MVTGAGTAVTHRLRCEEHRRELQNALVASAARIARSGAAQQERKTEVLVDRAELYEAPLLLQTALENGAMAESHVMHETVLCFLRRGLGLEPANSHLSTLYPNMCSLMDTVRHLFGESAVALLCGSPRSDFDTFTEFAHNHNIFTGGNRGMRLRSPAEPTEQGVIAQDVLSLLMMMQSSTTSKANFGARHVMFSVSLACDGMMLSPAIQMDRKLEVRCLSRRQHQVARRTHTSPPHTFLSFFLTGWLRLAT